MSYAGTARDPYQLTYTAVSRVFEENITYSPVEMDFKTFLDLILALENKVCALIYVILNLQTYLIHHPAAHLCAFTIQGAAFRRVRVQ